VGSRFPRTATNIIVALTALAWVVAAFLGQSDRAAYVLGFVPARFSGFVLPFATAPAWLTPLTATLVHSNLVHLGFNLLILLWCGAQVERVLGATGLIVLYVIGAYAAAAAQWAVAPLATVPVIGASGAISAVVGAYALSFGRAKPFTSNLRINRLINVLWLLVA
jgi:membrane associated rhomboid family serine protease